MISKTYCILSVFEFFQLVDEANTLRLASTYVGHCMFDISSLKRCQLTEAGEVQHQ